MQRTMIKEIIDKVGQKVLLQGWVNVRRDMGKIIFLDLRDRSGMAQVVVIPDSEEAKLKVSTKGGSALGGKSQKSKVYELAKTLRAEDVVSIIGMVNKRPEKMVNPNLATGAVEILAEDLEILNAAKTLPFEVNKDTGKVSEDLRLKYRYLDLRSERLQKNMRLRSDFVRLAREFLFKNDFIEIETPLLSKATPEGSRDFIVPSRLQPGKFYALPQAPQQYKQLLMVAGFERYFQIARALRDEDLRADRGFEHTQIDLEMSFVGRDDVMKIVEGMMINVVETMGYKIKEKPFPCFSYAEAMKKFGSDKFDLRNQKEKETGVLAYAWVVDFPFFTKSDDGGWTFTHNPFSMPLPEFMNNHLSGKNVSKILTSQYDLVCNGFEAGGGSIRAHKPETLKATYKIMGYSEKEIEESVGHMLEALEYGAPPHGGIALGVERNIMGLAGEDYLREVQAFPTNASGRTSVMDAPSALSEKQLKEAHIKVLNS